MSAPRGRQATATRGGRPVRSPERASDGSAGPTAASGPATTPVGPALVDLVTFGYKFGDPPPADLTFDVRFLANPFWVPELQPLSGLEEPVRDYVLGQPDAIHFLELLENLIEMTLPHYRDEGRSQITVALGCTGGFHRSIALAEELAARLRARDLTVAVHHRELPA